MLRYQAGYGFKERKHLASQFRVGEGLVGQCAQEKESILLTDVPSDYVTINSGLGESTPLNIIVLPILFEGSVRAVVELASFSRFSATHQAFLDQLTESIGLVLNTIEANTLTENLLKQSQSQAQELQSRQEDLRASNEDLAKQASRLADQNIEVEAKNQEVQSAKRLVEEKAEQLAVSSAFKSEFFANMSHELRTPLNSLLILAGELKANPEKNLTDDPGSVRQHHPVVGHRSAAAAQRRPGPGQDGVGHGRRSRSAELPLIELHDALEREFRHVADQQGVSFAVELAPGTPPIIATDPGRLRQVLKNLLTNAFKFTEHGDVTLRIGRPDSGWSPANGTLQSTSDVTAFSITDTGIGIAPEQQELIFEAFAQADGSTARQYGGTGLGLSISRELVGLLGGEMTLDSTLGRGQHLHRVPPVGARRGWPARLSSRGRRRRPSATTAWPTGRRARRFSASRQLGASTASRVPTLAGKKVLVVDDDFRNIFAITVLLERGEIEVVSAESGAGGDRRPASADRHRPRADGHHDAGHGRVCDDPGDPQALPDRPLPIVALTAKIGCRRAPALSRRGGHRLHPQAGRERPRFPACAVSVPPGCRACGIRRARVMADDRRGGVGHDAAPTGDPARQRSRGPAGGDRARCSRLSVWPSSRRTRAARRCGPSWAQTFALILMDVRMPAMDGYETANLIRQRSESSKTPIIFVTAFGRDDTETLTAYASGGSRLHLHARCCPMCCGPRSRCSSTCSSSRRSCGARVDSITALNAALRDSEASTQAVLDNVADGILIAGESGRDRIVQPLRRGAVRLPRRRGDRAAVGARDRAGSRDDLFAA